MVLRSFFFKFFSLVSDNRPGSRFRFHMDFCRPIDSGVRDTRSKQFHCWNVCAVRRRRYYANNFNSGLLWFTTRISLHVNDRKYRKCFYRSLQKINNISLSSSVSCCSFWSPKLQPALGPFITKAFWTICSESR